MIATGGLLRINARRQDSLRSKPHRAQALKKKAKKKRRSEVVVVKGKLKLCSVSGLVAVLGVLVLLVGVVMAALGYWPRDGLFFTSHPQEGATMASVSLGSTTTSPVVTQGGDRGQELEGDKDNIRGGGDKGHGGDEGFNETEGIDGTTRQLPQRFLEEFLERYLYSDRLKVFGPLVMGIGIFLFICANAVLHENRDKKTKVINLRDIYSTVIDLHSLRRPDSASSSSGAARRPSTNPLNGLINYVQSKSLEAKPKAYPASLQDRRLSRQPGNNGGEGEGGGDAVFSIYREQLHAPPPLSSSSSPSHRLSLPPSFSPPHLSTCSTSLEKEALNSFTLPLCHPRLPAPHRRHYAWAGTSQGREEEEQRRDRGGDRQEEEAEVFECPPPLGSSTVPPQRPFDSSAASCSSSNLHKEAPGGSQGLLSSSSLTPSHLSLSSLSHLLSSSSSTLTPPCRRRSLPSSNTMAGYSKLAKDESFEMTSTQGGGQRSQEVTSQRWKYTGPKQDEDEDEEDEDEEGRPIRR